MTMRFDSLPAPVEPLWQFKIRGLARDTAGKVKPAFLRVLACSTTEARAKASRDHPSLLVISCESEKCIMHPQTYRHSAI